MRAWLDGLSAQTRAAIITAVILITLAMISATL